MYGSAIKESYDFMRVFTRFSELIDDKESCKMFEVFHGVDIYIYFYSITFLKIAFNRLSNTSIGKYLNILRTQS